MTTPRTIKPVACNMGREAVYTDTAYNSLAPRKLEPSPPLEERSGYFTQVAMGAPLNLPGKAHCHEYAGEWRCDIRDLIELKKPGSDDKKNKKLGNPHLVDRWPSLFEWAIFSRILCYGAAWFAFAGGGFTSIYIFFAVGYKEALDLFTWGFLPLLSIWLILKFFSVSSNNRNPFTRRVNHLAAP